MWVPFYSALSKPTFPVSFTMGSYGMGWSIGTYREEDIIFHGGNVIGESAMVMLFPERKIGITILTNMDGQSTSLYEIAWVAADLVLGYEPWLDVPKACNFPCDFVNCSAVREFVDDVDGIGLGHRGRQPSDCDDSPKERPSFAKDEDDSPQPTISIPNWESYLGIYVHPTYDIVNVTKSDKGKLWLKWHSLEGELTQPDEHSPVLICQATGPFLLEPVSLPVKFNKNWDGRVDSVELPLEPLVAPIMFVNMNYQPRASCGYTPVIINNTVVREVEREGLSFISLVGIFLFGAVVAVAVGAAVSFLLYRHKFKRFFNAYQGYETLK